MTASLKVLAVVGERHLGNSVLDHRQISHLPVVEGVAKLMALLGGPEVMEPR